MPSPSRKIRSAAYSRAVRHYLADGYDAEAIVDLILSRLKPVADSTRNAYDELEPRSHLYVYNYAGIKGNLAVRHDKENRIVFAVYEKGDLTEATQLKCTRHKTRYSRAQRPIFLTAPEVWAHLNGYECKHLAKDDYAEWKERLERAAEIIDDELTRPEAPDSYLDLMHYLRVGNSPGFEYVREEGCDEEIREYKAALDKYKSKMFLSALPDLPDPYGDENSSGADEIWTRFEAILKRRLFLKRRRLIYRIWRHFVRRWKASACAISPRTEKVRGWPCIIMAADVYLAKKLRVSRHAIARAINDLDRLGYIQAVIYKPSAVPNKRGIYGYFPGSGFPPEQPTRHSEVTPRGALDWIRKTRASFAARQGERAKCA